MNEPDIEKLFAEFNAENIPVAEPSMNQNLEAARTALAFIKLCDAGKILPIYRYWTGLNEFEKAYAATSLARFALLGVQAAAAINGLEFHEQVQVFEREIEAAVQEGQE